MKQLLTLLLILCACTCLSAQDVPSIELKPGTTDSARWEVAYTFQGSEQIATTEWDTLPNIVEYGEVLYLSGGFIGAYRIDACEDLITAEVRTFVNTQGAIIDPVRQVVATELGSYGSYPITKDTASSYLLIGEYEINGPSCGMSADTMEFSIAGFNVELVLWHPKDDASGGQSVLILGEGVISVYSDVFSEQVTVVQQDSVTWRGANNCVWTKLD
jgi:hypothetical protein